MGLLGPNGSGKTTILRILTGYLRPSSGSAHVAGLDIVNDSLRARARIGYVPEDVPLYGSMAVREFLLFMARLKGLAGEAAAGAAASAVERLALGDVRRVLIGKLSRGYRQRVAIAQALLGHPDLLIFDEPTNGLDPRQIIEMRGYIRELAGEQTVVVTSHILGEIERVADRAAILLDGRLLGVHALRAGALGARLRLRVRGRPPAVRDCLAGAPGVVAASVEREEAADVATYLVDAGAAATAEALAAAVVRAGFGLLDLGPAPLDLEALFLGLTGAPPAPRPA
jgi:ABC-2 type transport system ATP-binding protein